MDAPTTARATRVFLLVGLVAMACMPWQDCRADHRDIVAAGTYSSLTYNEESEDLSGYEIEVLPTSKGIKLVLQIAEGELTDVVVSDASLANGTLTASFDLTGRGSCQLEAQIQDSSLVVTLDFGNGVSDTATLERSVGYWDRN